MHLFYRALYRLLASEKAVALATAGVRLARVARAGEPAREGLDWLTMRGAYGGWPGHSTGWVNLDVARFVWRVRHRLARSRRIEPRVARRVAAPLRVGWVGQFSGLLMDVTPVIRERPPGVAVHVFDVEYGGAHASYLAAHADGYAALAELGSSRSDTVEELSSAIRAAELDLLVVMLRDLEAYLVLDRIDTPKVAFVCTGSELLFHPRVTFNLFAQPQADYFEDGSGTLFCGTSRERFGLEPVHPAFLLFDLRDIDPGTGTPWASRGPSIVFHGSLYKAASEPFLECLFDVMSEVRDAELVLFGRDDGVALDRIRDAARGQRVRYKGAFRSLRDASGAIRDPGWTRLKHELGRARLAPDPFPIVGASSRVEAYALGTPTAHLAVRFDAASWGKSQPSEIEQPALIVEHATARTLDEYRELCLRALTDRSHAERVVQEQLAVVRRVTDPVAYWRMLLDRYAQEVTASEREA